MLASMLISQLHQEIFSFIETYFLCLRNALSDRSREYESFIQSKSYVSGKGLLASSMRVFLTKCISPTAS